MLRVAAELRFPVGSIAVNNDANARFSLITERPFLGAQSTSAPAAAPRLSQCKLAAGLLHRDAQHIRRLPRFTFVNHLPFEPSPPRYARRDPHISRYGLGLSAAVLSPRSFVPSRYQPWTSDQAMAGRTAGLVSLDLPRPQDSRGNDFQVGPVFIYSISGNVACAGLTHAMA